jgi:Tol biopolymer transport system component
MPNFGKDSDRMVCSFPLSPDSGVGLLTLATLERKVIDGSGWGGQWSPDGRLISYYRGKTLMLYDVEKETSERHCDLENYRQMYWNAGWTPDSKRLYFTTLTDSADRQRAICSVNIDDKPPVVVEHFRGRGMGERVTVHPTEARIMFQMISPETKLTQLYILDLDKKDSAPEPLKGQLTTSRNTDGVWSADGKRIFLSSAGEE